MTMSAAEKSKRYREKDIPAYRAKKRALTKTEKHRKKRREYMMVWREKNRARHNELARQSHARNKHKHVHKARARHLKVNYGITEADYQEMFLRQSGVCYICQGIPKKKLAVDHCHKTGKIRGLLCSKCNGNLGWYEKNGVRMLEYLSRSVA